MSSIDHLNSPSFDVVVVGGGVVGLAILRALTIAGHRVALVEKELDLLSWASGTNSGIICTGADAASGTLERALIRDSISQIRHYCREMNVPFRQCGSLVCRWPWENEELGLHKVLSDSHDAGDTDAVLLSSEQVQELEPNINTDCLEAVHIKGEIVVDSWLYSISLAVHAKQNGASIFTEFEVDSEKTSFNENRWNVKRKLKDKTSSIPLSLNTSVLINAAGVWADILSKDLTGDNPQFSVRPRRGQYRVYKASSKLSITHPIQPIPNHFSKGIFVFSTIHNQVVVGPTALDQESRTDRTVHQNVSKELDVYCRKILPALDGTSVCVGEFVGIRPGTEHRDYQVFFNTSKKVVSCAGIRSTGLTSSLGIGNYILRMLRNTGMLEAVELQHSIRTIPLPSIRELKQMYSIWLVGQKFL